MAKRLLLTIHDTSHFSKGNAAMCHGVNKIQKKTGNWGPGPWNSVITPKLWYSEIMDQDRGTPKTVACYSPLLVLVCWSVSQDPPPMPIEDIAVTVTGINVAVS